MFPVAAASNQFGGPMVSGQPAQATVSNGMQMVPQPMNYAGVPQQFVPPGYGFCAPPMMQGFPVYGTSPKQFSAANGAPVGQGSNSAGGVGGGTQQTAAQPAAAGSWSSQARPTVNPFLVSI